MTLKTTKMMKKKQNSGMKWGKKNAWKIFAADLFEM